MPGHRAAHRTGTCLHTTTGTQRVTVYATCFGTSFTQLIVLV